MKSSADQCNLVAEDAGILFGSVGGDLIKSKRHAITSGRYHMFRNLIVKEDLKASCCFSSV